MPDLAHSLVVVVGDLCQVALPKARQEDVQGHEVQLAGFNSQAQARLHRTGAGGLQAALP